jgi:hypothetical protein
MTDKEKLKIAVECLEKYANCENWYNIYDDESASFKPIYRHRKWKEDFGYKDAQNALKKIGGKK